MQNSLEQIVKEAVKQISLVLKKPQTGSKAFEIVEKMMHDLENFKESYESIFIETLGYALLCQIDFVNNVTLLHPSSVYQEWFFDKVKGNLNLIETMTSAITVNNIDLFNETASQLIENNIAFERLQLALLIEQRVGRIIRDLREGLNNAAFFYSSLEMLMIAISFQQPEDREIIDRLLYSLFFLGEKPYDEVANALLPKAVGIINPAISEEQREVLRQEAKALISKLPVKSYPNFWFFDLMAEAEQNETNKLVHLIKNAKTLQHAEPLLSDAFILCNAFKRRYQKEDSSYIAFSSAARACIIARNLLYTLPSDHHPEIFQAIFGIFNALASFLKNRWGTPDETPKVDELQKSALAMKEHFQVLLSAANGLSKRHP